MLNIICFLVAFVLFFEFLDIFFEILYEIVKSFRDARLDFKYGNLHYYAVYFDNDIDGLIFNSRTFDALRAHLISILEIRKSSCVIFELPYEKCEDVSMWNCICKLSLEGETENEKI